MNKSSILSVVVCVLGLTSSGYTLANKLDGSSVRTDPEQIVSILRGSKQDEITTMAKELQLVGPIYGRYGVVGYEPCEDFDDVSLEYVNLLKKGHEAVIIAKDSFVCQREFVIVMSKKGDLWMIAKTIPLNIKHVTPKISYKSLVNVDEKEIVIENHETDSGTGILQSNTSIWKLLSPAQVELVFYEPSKIHFELIGDEFERHKSNFEEINNYRFIAVCNRKECDKCSIEKNQIITKYHNKIVRWMRYCWDPEIEHFQSYSWAP